LKLLGSLLLEHFKEKHFFVSIGNGSIGGKGHCLLFLDRLISKINSEVFCKPPFFYELDKKRRIINGPTTVGRSPLSVVNNSSPKSEDLQNIPQLVFCIPRTLVLSTSVFVSFIEDHNLQKFSSVETSGKYSDAYIASVFISHDLSPEIVNQLRLFLEAIKTPLAVRASSLLEDSKRCPLSGNYASYFLGNSHPSLVVRLYELCTAVRLVYASTYYSVNQTYRETVGLSSAAEAMAVLIQEVCGRVHEKSKLFYPHATCSTERMCFYPFRTDALQMQHDDGLSSVCVGLGHSLHSSYGRPQRYRFCPKYPSAPLYFHNTELIKNAQRTFFALDLSATSDVGVARAKQWERIRVENYLLQDSHNSVIHQEQLRNIQQIKEMLYKENDELPNEVASYSPDDSFQWPHSSEPTNSLEKSKVSSYCHACQSGNSTINIFSEAEFDSSIDPVTNPSPFGLPPVVVRRDLNEAEDDGVLGVVGCELYDSNSGMLRKYAEGSEAFRPSDMQTRCPTFYKILNSELPLPLGIIITAILDIMYREMQV
jgi:hypothetical protein